MVKLVTENGSIFPVNRRRGSLADLKRHDDRTRDYMAMRYPVPSENTMARRDVSP